MTSIQKRDSGWQVRWRGTDGRQCKQTFGRKVDAEAHVTSVNGALLGGTYVAPRAGKVTVGDYAPVWMATKVNLKPKTRAGYESLLKSQIQPRWSKAALSGITYGAAAAWVAQMVGDGLSASRTRQAYQLLSAILDHAVKDSKIARNPVVGVDLPRMTITARRYLTHEQVSDLADACKDYGTLVLVLAYCGIRWGEAAALRVDRVDLLRGRLEIVEAVVDVKGQMIFGSPKSHQHRSVPVPKFLHEDLKAAMVGKGPGELVFTSPQGEVLRVQNFRRRGFDRAAKSVGLDGLVPHELRHTAASLAIASGANVKAVQKMLGHKSAALTLDRYGHLFEDELDTVAERLNDARAKARAPLVRPSASVADLADRRKAAHQR